MTKNKISGFSRGEELSPETPFLPEVPLLHLQSLPVLVISLSGLRRAALVVLDRAFQVRITRVVYLRHRENTNERLKLLEQVLEDVTKKYPIHLVVLDADARNSSGLSAVKKTVLALAIRTAAWYREISSSRILDALGGNRKHVVSELAATYSTLAAKLDFSKLSLFRNRDHERELRPMLGAFLLAHGIRMELENKK